MFKFLEQVEDAGRLEKIIKNLIIVEAHGYWLNHYVFDKPPDARIQYFVGASRADEIVVNIILPIANLYFEIFGKEKAAKNVLKLFVNYSQQSENKLVNEISDSFGLRRVKKRAVLYQGMIELFRNNCGYVEACKECPMGRKVFQ
jgi:hypothetical protein